MIDELDAELLGDIEDLRVAVDEACACLMQDCEDDEHKSGHHLELTYEVLGDKLLIEGSAPCAVGRTVEIHPVARELLDMTADEYDVYDTATGRAFRLVKHRQNAKV